MDDSGSTLLARYPAVSRHLFTVDDYHRMGEAGMLTEDDRVELIEGKLVETAPIGSEHAGCVGLRGRDRSAPWKSKRFRACASPPIGFSAEVVEEDIKSAAPPAV